MIKTTSQFGWAKKDTVKNDPRRVPDDLYPTPPEATEALLRAATFSKMIWEPAPGAGHISKVLEQHGHRVTSTDLRAHEYEFGAPHNFLTSHRAVDNIVTNPPYKHLLAFISKGIEASRRTLALLVPVNALSNLGSVRLLTELGYPNQVLVLIPTLKIDMGATRGTQRSIFHHCWCAWDKSQPKAQHNIFTHLDWRQGVHK